MAKQGGVHFSFLIVALVICLGLVFFAVIQNSDKQKLVAERQAANNEVKQKESQVRSLTEELNRAKEVLFGPNSTSSAYESIEKSLADASAEWSKVRGTNEVSFQSVEAFMGSVYDATKHWRREYETQKTFATTKDESYVNELESKQTIVAAKMDEINTQKGRIEDLSTQLEASEAEGREKVSRLQNELEETIDDYNNQVSRKEKENWVLKNQLDQSRRRIEHLESEIIKEKTFAKADPDGQVIQVADELGYAWINLGRAQRLRTGLVFDVFNYVKGGKKQRKGQIEIMKIEEDIAQARITGSIDRFNPISEGDYVASPFYNKDDVPVFVFAGEKLASQRISKDELKRKIGQYGGKVEDEVKIKTTFVVALDGYEVSTEYATARRLGITIVGERELLNFVGY